MVGLHARVRCQLDAAGAAYLVRDHGAMAVEITSPDDFAAALGYPLSRIMKTLVCHSRSTGTSVAVVCPIDVRIDFKSVARQLNCGRLSTAGPEQLESLTGYAPGGVSPLGLAEQLRVAIARRTLTHATVLVGGGAPGVEVELAPSELIRVTSGVLIDL